MAKPVMTGIFAKNQNEARRVADFRHRLIGTRADGASNG